MQENNEKILKPKKGFWFDATPTPHTTKTLKNGSDKTYYVFSIPAWAIERGEIDPIQKYRIELYPLENKKEKEGE